MSDIEIARNTPIYAITKIAEELKLKPENIELYGNDKAKITEQVYENLKDKQDGKLILVTAINPTPLGEGKTTVSIGLADGLRKIGEQSILALREPSLGPVFGMKGGATGGGYSQIVPMEDINLHFTGDIHAITAANNLLAAMIDNHIYFGNALKIKKVVWKRCLDLNDRQLRVVTTGLSDEKNMVAREDHFQISVASEVMAILCLAKDLKDLKRRLGNIVIGYDVENKPITAKMIKAEGSMAVLLKDALKPNLVQTLEHTPAIVHGGPFANIAHGCNSIIATKLALKLADYTVTEAGFGADLGAEKFMDIKCRVANLKPDAVVCVATLKALKYHGGAEKETALYENKEALDKGIQQLYKHIHNLRDLFGMNVIVAMNKYAQDSQTEIAFVKEKLFAQNIEMSLVESWEFGGKGAVDLAKKVVSLTKKESSLHFIYQLEDSIETKIEKVATKVYGAEKIEISKEAKEQIEHLKQLGYSHLPICIAKTPYSFSDDPKNLECNDPFTIHVKEVILNAGAEFIVVLTGKIVTMPGLPKVPVAEKIDIDEHNHIIGIF